MLSLERGGAKNMQEKSEKNSITRKTQIKKDHYYILLHLTKISSAQPFNIPKTLK